MSRNIIDLQNRITDLKGQIDAISHGGEVSPEDAVRLGELHGRLDEATQNLISASAELQAENERIAAEAAANHTEIIRDAAHLIFGAKDEFEAAGGIQPGWKVTVPSAALHAATMAARFIASPRNGVSGLKTPSYTDYDLPAPIAPIMGFLDTLPHGLTDGDEHYYQTPSLVNNAAGWTTGNKAESSIEWTEAVANIETIAHYMPITKPAARRYRQLENTVAGALLLGLSITKNRYAIKGANSSGIVGAHNLQGALSYTPQADDENIYDIAVEMALRVRLMTGFTPNYVVVSPQALTKARKAKDKNGRYLYPEIVQDNKINGMQIVEDVEMHIVSEEGGVRTEKDAMGVYFSGAASWNTADPDEVEIGLIDKQFVQNSYTLRGEGTYAFKSMFPGGFCWCDDISANVTPVDSE